jgi:DNA primase
MEKYEIQKLRDLPIEKVAKEMGMKVEHHKALCPFHDDHHASLSFNTRKNNCRCYVCMGDSVGTIDLVMKYLGKDFLSACRWLAEEHQVQLEEDRKREASSSSSSPGDSSSGGSSPEDNSGGSSSGKSSFDAGKYARFFEHPWLNGAARRFLFDERRIDERVARWCRLTSWTDRKGVNWLQIPYFDMEGKLIGIQNRNLDYKKNQKVLVDAPRFRFPYGARCSIYNLPVVKMLKPGEQLFITEGCSDCWAMLSAGHKAIAIPSATMLKLDDKKWLAEMGELLHMEWHMFPDKDAPGESLFLQLKEILPQLVHHQLPPECKDFSEYYLKEKK